MGGGCSLLLRICHEQCDDAPDHVNGRKYRNDDHAQACDEKCIQVFVIHPRDPVMDLVGVIRFICLLGLIGFVIVQHVHEYHARKPAHNVVSFCSNSRLREFPEDDLTGRFNAFSEHGVEHDLPTEAIEGLLECFVEV